MHARTTTRRIPLIALLLSLCGLLAGNAALANVAGPGVARSSVSELYNVALLMDAAVLDFNMLIGEDQSPIYKARLDTTIRDLRQAQKTAPNTLGAAGVTAQDSQDINAHLAAFIRALDENRDTTLASGAPEGALVDEMMAQRKAVRQTLDRVYLDLQKQAGIKADSPISEARARALILQEMAALYIETTAAAGGVSYRSQEAGEATIDELARDFTQRLTTLAGQARGKESAAIVRTIQTKWHFIEKSLLNYHENAVPYLVDRYTQAIVDDLAKLADALDRGA